MPLLPLRALPVNESHEGPLVVRIDPRPTGSVYVYVRRESDKQTWICKVRSLQEILAPTQQARALTVTSIITCLYHGVAYDSFASNAFSTLPVELHRREVSFTRPETWSDGGYRLTMRVAVRSAAVAMSAPDRMDDNRAVAEAIPIVDIADDDVVFGLNFTLTDFDLDHKPPTPTLVRDNRTACVHSTGVAFPNAYLNWEPFKGKDFLRIATDGMEYLRHVTRVGPAFPIEVTVDVVHPKGAAVFVLAINSQAVQPATSTSFPQGDLYHTVAQYQLRVSPKAWIQVVTLPGSVPVLGGSSFTLRELS